MTGRSPDLSARRTADALALLPSHEWTVLDDLQAPGMRRTRIDHVVVGPPGVFVVTATDWTGRITIKDGVLRHRGRRCDAAVEAAADVAASMRRLVVAIQDVPVCAVLCVANDDELEAEAGNILLGSTATLASTLTSRPPVLLPAVRDDVVRQLMAKLAHADRPRRTPARRQMTNNLVSSLVGASLALVVLASQPDVLDRVGDALVSLVSDDDPQPPADEPTELAPTDAPGP